MNMDQITYRCLHTDSKGFYDCPSYADGKEIPQGVAKHPYCHSHTVASPDWAFCGHQEGPGEKTCFEWVPWGVPLCQKHGGVSFKDGSHRKHYALYGIPGKQDSPSIPQRCLVADGDGHLVCLRPAYIHGIVHPFCKDHVKNVALQELWAVCSHPGCAKWRRRTPEAHNRCTEHGGEDFLGGSHAGYLKTCPTIAYFRGLPVAQCHHRSSLGLQCDKQARIFHWEQQDAEGKGTGTYFWATFPYCLGHAENEKNEPRWVVCSRCDVLKKGKYVWLEKVRLDGPHICSIHDSASNSSPYLFEGGPGREALFASEPRKRAQGSLQVTPEKPIPPTLEVDSGVKTLAERMKESVKLLTTANFKIVGLGEDAKQTEQALQIFFGTYEELIGVALSVLNRAAVPSPPITLEISMEEVQKKLEEKKDWENVNQQISYAPGDRAPMFLGLPVRTSLLYAERREIMLCIGSNKGKGYNPDLEQLVNLIHASHGQMFMAADASSKEDQVKLTFRFPSLAEALAVYAFLEKVLAPPGKVGCAGS